MEKIIFVMTLFLSPTLLAYPITINVVKFADEIYSAENNPDFIERYETGDKSQFVTFRTKAWDHADAKVVIEKVVNASYGSFPRYSLIKTDLYCHDQILKRTFFLFDEFGNLGRYDEQESTVLAMNSNLGKIACSNE